jgi:2'-5' RNA ligase
MTKNAEEIRAFIAIELPEPVKVFLNRVAGELQLCRADVKWVKPAGMHLTLKFLGSVRTELLPAIREELEPAFGSQGTIARNRSDSPGKSAHSALT